MADPRKAHIDEMNRLVEAICKTKSPYLRSDYGKALKRMEIELKEYDMLMMKRSNNGRLRTESSSE